MNIILMRINSNLELNCQERFKKIEHYQFLQLLGKGANGLVYKGLNALDGSFVAIKQMIIGKSEMKSIKAQLSFLKKLDNPSIVKYIDAVQKDNRIYLILQYIEGGSLRDLARQSNLNEDIIKIYIKQVLVGLNFLHKQGVIHRDIKGANILITKHGKVKLADFGVAIKIEQSQKTISAAGSPYWIAPQIITGETQPSFKCDIWSVGCTVIQLLTGNPPYFQLMQFPALFRIVEDQHPPIPDCSKQCKNFLLSCFVKNPLKRQNATELLSHPWLKTNDKMESFSDKSEYQKQLERDIQKALKLPINYKQLLDLINRISPHLQCIYKNPLFSNFRNDLSYKRIPTFISYEHISSSKESMININPRSNRLKICCTLIKDNRTGLEYLDFLGFIQEQIDSINLYMSEFISLYQKKLPLSSHQKKQEYEILLLTSNFIQQIIKLQINEKDNPYSENNVKILGIVTKYILPLIGTLLKFIREKYRLLKENKGNIQPYELSIIKLFVSCIYQLLFIYKQTSMSQKCPQRNDQIAGEFLMLHNFCEILVKTGILQQILNTEELQLGEYNEDELELYLLKLEIQIKIIPSFLNSACRDYSFKQISIQIVKKLVSCVLKNSFLPSQQIMNPFRDKIVMAKLLLIHKLAESQIGRSLLQRKGIIVHLASFYENVKNYQHISEMKALQFIQISEITAKMLVDINRSLQFQRHIHHTLFQEIKKLISNIKMSDKKSQKIDISHNYNVLVQKINVIQTILSK